MRELRMWSGAGVAVLHRQRVRWLLEAQCARLL